MINKRIVGVLMVAVGGVSSGMLPDTAAAHFHLLPHSHYVVDVYGKIPETYGPTVIREYCNGSPSNTGNFSHNDSWEARNGWGISIGFVHSVVSSAVRFDVTQKRIVQNSYQQPVAPMTCVELSRSEIYEITPFVGMTRWLWDTEYGMGFAGQFKYPIYAISQRSL